MADIKKYINLDRIRNDIDTLNPIINLIGIENVTQTYYETEQEMHDEIFKMVKQLFTPVLKSVMNTISEEFDEGDILTSEKLNEYLVMIIISNIVLLMEKSLLDIFDEIMLPYKNCEEVRK